MPITPNEAKERATPDKETLKNLERRIDECIVKAIQKGMDPVLDASIFPDASTRETIRERYRRAGWKVKFHCDYRDDDYVTFTPVRKKAAYNDPRDSLVQSYDIYDR